MVQEHPVECPKCGYDTGLTEERLMGAVLFESVICPVCGYIIIPIVTWEA